MSSATDEWAWARRESEIPQPVVGHERVTAILVVHNGEAWLPLALKGLASLDRRPGRLIAVDAGSMDGSWHMLEEAYQQGVVAQGRVIPGVISEIRDVAAASFSKIVNDVVASLEPDTGWIWLLHDDATPGPGCLSELLRVATSPTPEDGPAIVVPKLLRPKLRHRPDQVQSVGEAVSVAGDRVVAAELDDLDQHQDESVRVLGASTAGLLIRRDAWATLGGLAVQLPGFRAGIDLGWRANEARLVVKTAPDAVLRHQQAGLAGLREADTDPRVDDAVAGLRVVVAHSRRPSLAGPRGRLIRRLSMVGAWLAKDRDQAKFQSSVLRQFGRQSDLTHGLTADVRAEAAQRVPKTLLPGAMWGIRHAIDTALQRVPVVDDWGEGSISLDTLTGDDDTLVMAPVPRKSMLGLGAAIVMVLATLLATRSLFGLSPLISTGLVPSPGSLSATWQAWLTPGATPGANAPWLAIMALGSTLTGGQAGVWASVMVLGGVFFSSVSAYHFVKMLVGSPPLRLALAALWAVLLPVTGASSDGSPGWVLLGVALPWAGAALVRWVREPVRGLVGVRAPASLAGALTIIGCVTPALVPACWMAAFAVSRRRHDWRGLVLTVLFPLLVLGPWIIRLTSEPGRLLTGVDPLLSRLRAAPAPLGVLTGQLGLGAPTPQWVGYAVFGALWLGALICLVRLNSWWRGWLVGGWVTSLLAAVVASRLIVSIDGEAVRAASLPWLLLGGFIAISAVAAVGQPDNRRQNRRLVRRSGVTLIGVLVTFGAVVGGGWWLWGGEAHPLQRQATYVPDYVTAAEASPRVARTLVVSVVDGQASVSLRDAGGPTWGDGEQSPWRFDVSSRASLAGIAGQFADGYASNDLAQRLRDFGIGYVIVMGAPQVAIDAMMGVPDLVGGVSSGVAVWTVGGLPSRATLMDGTTVTQLSEGVVPPGAGGRVLVLGERTGLPWQVSVGGTQLKPTQASTHFVVPAAGGDLRWWLPVMWWALAWHAGVWVVLCWMMLPSSRTAERTAQSLARRST